jgi:hypothetical protein
MHATLATFATATLLACAPAMAYPAADPARSHLAEIDVWDRTSGERLPVYWHDGQRWVVGAPGHRYAVSVRNRQPGRILTVLAVDGVNAVSGETADWSQRGYVLAPGQAFDVLGWRKSTATVADFVFTTVADSYAARTGRAADVGVIGVAVFCEAPRPSLAPVAKPAPRAEAADGNTTATAPALPAAGAAARRAEAVPEAAAADRQRLGTGHGDIESSIVAMVDFERRQDRPDDVITIRYDRYERLLALGVIEPMHAPDAFPGSADAGFVADPPARR